MSEQNLEFSLTRRQILAASAITLTGLGTAKTLAQTQPPKTDNKGARVSVTEEELEEWTTVFLAGLTAGSSLAKNLVAAGNKTDNVHLHRFSKDAVDILEKGYTLSDIMEINRHLFDRNYVTTVRFGEIYGELDVALSKWLTNRPKRT